MPKYTNYVSSTTEFIRDIKKSHPELEAKATGLRATWWDKNPEHVEEERQKHSHDLPMRGYEYFSYKG